MFNTPQIHHLLATRTSRELWGQCPGLASSPRSGDACSEIVKPQLPWLNQVLYRPWWWEDAPAQGTIVVNLCRYGLDEEALVWELQPFLQNQAVTFVCQLINIARDWCSEILQQLDLLDCYAAEEEEDSPMATPGPATSLGGTSAPTPREQEELHKELGQAVADRSVAGQGRDGLPWWP